MKIEMKVPGSVGPFIDYEENGTFVTFDNKLSLNLAGYQQAEDVHLDICRDKSGNLVCGVIPGIAEMYVAELDIPGLQHEIVQAEGVEDMADGLAEDGDPMNMPTATREAVPLSMEDCTLTLWPLV